MKKIRIATVLAIVVAIFLSITVYCGTEPMPYVMDEADILSEYEETELYEKLNDISSRAKCHVIVVTVERTGTLDVWEYAKNYFHGCGYGYGEDKSGILLLLSTENRDYAIYTYGKAWDKFDSDALDELEEAMLKHLKADNYYRGFISYADVCEDVLIYHFDIVTNLLIAVAIGALIAFLILSSMKAKLKSVHAQRAASNYVRNGSFVLTKDIDIYLYRNITRRRRSNESSSSRGGSISRGGSRSSGGGRSGKY